MGFHEQIDALIDDTQRSLALFGPELALCGTIILLLLCRLVIGDRLSSTLVAFAGTVVGLVAALFSWSQVAGTSQEAFTGMLVIDSFTIYFRIFLLAFAVLFVVFTWRSGIPDREDAADFYTLALGSLLGMCLMVAANHLLMVFMAFEMASVPSYVLAGILKGRRKSSEAALKFAVYGAGAAGIMLYGISLIAGVTGTVHLPSIGASLANTMAADPSSSVLWVLGLGGLMVMVGLAFKLSAVPFHFWAPDVFEGAAAEVGGFLSVASKAAAIALLVRVAIGFGFVQEASAWVDAEDQSVVQTTNGVDQTSIASASGETTSQIFIAARIQDGNSASGQNSQDVQTTGADHQQGTDQQDTDQQSGDQQGTDQQGADQQTELTQPDESQLSPEQQAAEAERLAEEARALGIAQRREAQEVANESLGPVRTYISYLVGFLAAITCTFGNMAAYGQSNIKRLLAYSTIAHAGYMMFAVAGAIPSIGTSTTLAQDHISALAVYVAVYLFMNFTAFAIIAFLRNQTGSEEISSYAGLIRTSPGLAVCFSLLLMSLIGLPPLAGFAAKLLVFSALADSGLWVLLIVGALNTVISLFYYLRVIKAMCLDVPEEGQQVAVFPIWKNIDGWFIFLLTLPVVVLGLFWGPLREWALAACSQLLS
ncbi:MAG: NADH-quinone oxidoreductase subunit N [Pirellulales bacterium]|nr:NADH-quinone oxidoreductase subunit N [Pirellulales bacterium]